jgi:DNA primase
MKSPHYGGPGGSRGYALARKSHSTRSRPTVHDIKTAISPAEFYQHEIATMPPPKRGGWVDGGLCPFHGDRISGNFRVNVDTGAYKCFACGASGPDVISFVRERYELGFAQALEHLAGEWGIS